MDPHVHHDDQLCSPSNGPYLMQEHRQLIKRAITSSGDQLDKSTQIFENALGLLRQTFNESFMESTFCILYWTFSDTLSSLVDRRHLI
jgi:hypothetical protein